MDNDVSNGVFTYQNCLRLLAIGTSFWLPLLVGYSAGLFRPIPRTVAEGSVAYAGIASLVIGFFGVLFLRSEFVYQKVCYVLLYLLIAPIVLFFTGWSGMLLSGYGY
ncbi:hypothetical protein SAMN05216588_13516 [Pseudomonas flavescens]|uniref:Uncharacterized protein n=1 Tax=Phytopseudomonas flavescens TaxID=29435 RepID=A0A1G8QG02_9GAMM|nr:hypothetical protein SAMN05216588_13516 [Pseudomonas flavescens]